MVCIDDQATITYEVCLIGDGNQPTEISLDLDALPSGFTIAGGDFDASGNAIIELIPNGECQEVELILSVDAGVIPGTSVSIGLNATADKDCFDYTTEPHSTILDPMNCTDFTCPCENGINISAGSGTLLSNTNLPSNVLFNNNSCLAINGRLIINEDYTIYFGEIRMQPGAEIVVADNASLYLIGINQSGGIHGCDQMWRGITVEETGQLIFRFNTIQDAQYAIKALNNSSLRVTENTFNKNYVGIHVPDNGGQFQNINLMTPIVPNIFTCDISQCGMLDPYPGQTPIPDEIPYAGIDVHDVFFPVGSLDNTLGVNEFSNLQNGVVAHESFLTVYYGDFQNMIKLDPSHLHYTGAPDGVGIFVENGVTDLIENKFNGADVGILTRRTAMLNTLNENISNVNYGISISEATWSPNLMGNHISYIHTGLEVWFPEAAITPQIEDNVFTAANTTYPQSRSIDLRYLPEGSPQLAPIKDNIFNLKNMARGISADFCSYLGIQGSIITYLDMTTSAAIVPVGIHLANVNKSILYDNSVTSTNPTVASSGYTFLASSDNKVCCNSVEGTHYGFYFSGNCDNTHFSNNSMGTHFRALNCKASTIIGQQNNTNNSWNGTVIQNPPLNTAAAVHLGNLDDRLSSQFRINTCNQPLWPSSIYPNQSCNPGLSWFIPFDGTNEICEEDSECFPPPFLIFSEEDMITENDIRTANGIYLSSDYGEMLHWEKSRHLFSRMEAEITLHSQNNTVDSFYTALGQQNVAAFEQIDQLTKAFHEINESSRTTIDGYFNTVSAWLDSLTIIDQMFATVNTVQDSLTISGLRVDVLNNIATLFVSYQDIIKPWRENKLNQIPQMATLNDNISTSLLVEQNEKTVNEVFLETVATGIMTLTPTQEALIADIANQCPLAGGRAVAKARTLYSLMYKVDYDDEALCNGTGEERRESITKKIKQDAFDFVITPNPASDKINIRWSGDLKGQRYTIRFHTLTGDLITEILLNSLSQHQTIDVSQLTGGIYICSLFLDSQRVQTKKLVIMK